jgi:flagellar biosynthetic protein FlhB
MSESDDKTQAPTQRRRQQAREAGQVAHSPDLGSAVLLLGSLGLILVAGGALVSFLVEFMQASLGGKAWQTGLDASAARERASQEGQALAATLGRLLLPLLGAATLLALVVHGVQTAFLFMPRRMLPDFSRVNPLSGFGRLWSGENFARLAFGLCKLAAVAAVGLAGLWSRRHDLASLTSFDVPQMALRAWEACLWSCLEMGGALFALAAVDYLFQRSRLERSLQMTPQEIREEMRELQGDPQLAARRRDMARRRSESLAAGKPHHASAPTDRRPIVGNAGHVGSVESI